MIGKSSMNWGRAVFLPFVFILSDLTSISGFAQTWTRTSAPNAQWVNVTLSPDGREIVASGLSGTYVSTNFGNSWINPKTPVLITVTSADGSKWVGQDVDGNIYVSTNSAVSWNGVGMFTVDGFDLSADGNLLVCAGIEVSTNMGNSHTFVLSSPIGVLKMAANGTKWLVFNENANFSLFCSTNGGTTWTSNSLPSTNISRFASSADGNRIVAADERHSGYIYVSDDSGASWIKTTAPSNFWNAVASSADGTRLAAVANSIYTSTNGGITWVSNSAPITDWATIASWAHLSFLQG